jgi:tRNA dimethylallyltransferase
MEKIWVIVGPTAVGKGEVGFELAKRTGAEVISADSMKIYRGLDIGTAKPSVEKRKQVVYHFIDWVEPDQLYSAAQFAEEARRKIREIRKRGKKVLVVGGTGLYIRALTQGLFLGPPANPELRQKLREKKEKYGQDFLYQELKKIDPEAAEKIHPHDWIRLCRALEVFSLTGKPISFWQKQGDYPKIENEFIICGLLREKESLNQRIEQRVDQMIEQGLVEEVKKIISRGYQENLPALQALGYKEIIGYLKGRYSLKEAIKKIKRRTKLFSKRQLTWFSKMEKISWLKIDGCSVEEVVVPLRKKFI